MCQIRKKPSMTSRLGGLLAASSSDRCMAPEPKKVAIKAGGLDRCTAPKPKKVRCDIVRRGCSSKSLPKDQAGLTADKKCNKEGPVVESSRLDRLVQHDSVERGCSNTAGSAASSKCNKASPVNESGSRLDRLVQQSATSVKRKQSLEPQQSLKRHCSGSGSKSTSMPHENKCTVDSADMMETDEQHKLRHPIFHHSCPRCLFLRHGHHWRRIAAWKVDSETCISWLAPRPPHMGGAWALGCRACAAIVERNTLSATKKKREPGRGKWQAKLRASNWARFRVTRLLTTRQVAGAISNHNSSAFHRKAVLYHTSEIHAATCKTESRGPDLAASSTHKAGLTAAPSLTIEAVGLTTATDEQATDEEAEALLKGRVPQLQDWIDAWASASSTTSYRKENRVRQKRSQGRTSANIRTRRRKQVRVIADVIRDQHRQAVTAATSISLAVDSRGKYKVARFRCDSQHHPYYLDGILGAFHCGYESLEDADADHGVRMQQNLQRCITRFWTPLGGGGHMADEEKQMLKKIRCLSSDGAASERKLMFRVVRTLCPGVALVIRDFAHAARIAVQRPQQFDPVFNAVHTHLFNNGLSEKKHAVIPDIQYSDKLKDLLVSAQQLYLRLPAERSPLKVVLRHLSFAKHRFDSMADPVAKTAVMLLPICTLLSTISCDNRVSKEKRERAASALQLFTPKFCLSLGALADYGVITQSFIRKFDSLHHDIAASERELLHFERKMRKIFVDGWFLASHAETAAGDGPRLLKGQFITELVRRQTKKSAVFSAGPKQLLVWGPNTAEEVREIKDRCSYMTEVMLERLRAESDCDQLRSSFQAFDRARMLEGRLDRPYVPGEGSNDARRACLRGIRRLAKALEMDQDMQGVVVLEYVDVAQTICKEEAGLTATPDNQCNREMWCKVLDDTWLRKHFASRIAPVVHLQAIIRLYLSVLDGECQVERDLGGILAEAKEHCNLHTDGVDDLMMLTTSKLKESADFGDVARGEITAFTKACLRLWRAEYGCRFGCYDNKPRRQIRRRKHKQTFASLKRDVHEAARARMLLTRQARPLSALGDVPVGKSCTDLAASDFSTKRHHRFLERTKAKKREARLAMEKREHGEDPFPATTTKAACPSFPSLDHVTKVAMLIVPQPAGLTAGGRPMFMETGPHRCFNAQIVVTDTLAPLLIQQSGSHHMSLVDAIYIVGLGRMVTSTTSWCRATGDPRRLTEQQVTDHEPMVLKLAIDISFSRTLRAVRPEIYKALKQCCRVARSKWHMRQAVTAEEGREWFGDEQDIWKFLRRVREVINYRGPKVARLASGLTAM